MASREPHRPSGELGTPEEITEPSAQHPADHSLTLQMGLDMNRSIGTLTERTDGMRQELTALRGDISGLRDEVTTIHRTMLGRGGWWAGIAVMVTVIGTLIATLVGIATMYFSNTGLQAYEPSSSIRQSPEYHQTPSSNKSDQN